MNERIKLLAWQANFTEQNILDMSPGFEKFAELIVVECSAFVYNYPEKYLTRNQAREISMSMEEHFGVEE